VKQINNIFDLEKAARNKKSVINERFKKPIPAAVAMNFTAHYLIMLFKEGLYIYSKPPHINPILLSEKGPFTGKG